MREYECSTMAYKDSLVRKLIYKIEVYRDKLIVTFKSGTEVEVEY